MATPEGKVKGWLKKMLDEEKVFHFSPQAGPYGTAGVSDVVGILCGLFLAIEVKADASKKMTALQERFKDKVFEAGGWHFLVYDKKSIEEVREFVQYVRACNSRQKGISGVIPRPRYYTERNPKRKTSKRKSSPSSPQAGRSPSASELGIPDTRANPVLLPLAGPLQAYEPSAINSSLPN